MYNGSIESPKKCYPFFHKWETIYREGTDEFEGVTYNDPKPTEYRRCSKCNFTQEYHFDSQGGCWMWLKKEEAKILNLKIKWKEGKLFIPKVNNQPGGFE